MNYGQAEFLIQNLPIFKSLYDSMKICLESKSDLIYADAMRAKQSDSVNVQSGKTSDSTSNFATNLKGCEYRSQKEIANEIMILGQIIDKINIAIRSLPERDRIIINLYYIKGYKWKEVCLSSEMRKYNGIGIDNLKKIRQKSVNQILKIIQITDEEYNWVVDLLKLKEVVGG